jgi:hypothetical protein
LLQYWIKLLAKKYSSFCHREFLENLYCSNNNKEEGQRFENGRTIETEIAKLIKVSKEI